MWERGALQQDRASFETAALRPPQHDESMMALRKMVILRACKAGVSKDARRRSQHLANRENNEDHRCHPHTIRLGKHPLDDLRPPHGAADRQERSRPARRHDGPRRHRARLSRHLFQPGEPRRAGPDPLSETAPDGSGPTRPRAPEPPLMGACPRRDGAGDRRL